MLVKTEAIVIKNTLLGGDKIIATLFTKAIGCVSVVTRFSSSPKSKIKKQLFVPLSLLNVELEYKETSALQKLKNVSLNIPFADIPFNPYKLSISFFVSEITFYSLRGENENAQLYDFIVGSLCWLDAIKTECSNFHIVYMLGLLEFLGFMPNVDSYHEGDSFDLRNACFDSGVKEHKDYVGSVEASHIVSLLRMNYSTMHLFKMSHSDRNRIVEVLVDFYRLHIPNFPEPKSLDVLKQLYA